MPRKSTRKRKTDHPYLTANPDFPLSPHIDKKRGIGRWYKTIRGKRHYFGAVDDPDAALRRYEAAQDQLEADTNSVRSDGVTLKDVANEWLDARAADRKDGEITDQTFDSYYRIAQNVCDVLGKNTPVAVLAPAHFSKLARTIRRKSSPTNANKSRTVIKMMLKWAWESEIIPDAVRFGPDFRPMKKADKRAAKHAKGRMTFTAAEIRTLLDAASIDLKAFILLGINGGLYSKDISDLTPSDIDLKKAVIDDQRVKTKVDRQIPLWPSTVKAIRAAMVQERNPKASARGLLFCTATGLPWYRESLKKRYDGSPKLYKVDQVGKEFRELQQACGLHRSGRGFGHFRHSHRTISDGAGDPHAAMRVMGHELPGISSHYIETIEWDRLRRVTNHVHEWLFGESFAEGPGVAGKIGAA